MSKQKNLHSNALMEGVYGELSLCMYHIKRFRELVYLSIESYKKATTPSAKASILDECVSELLKLKKLVVKARGDLAKISKEKDSVIRKIASQRFAYRVIKGKIKSVNELLGRTVLGIEIFILKLKNYEKRRFKPPFHLGILLFRFYSVIHKSLRFAFIAVLEISKYIDMRYLFENKFSNYHVSPSTIKKGDVLLSFKTSEFLKEHVLSRIISITEESKITHASLAYSNRKGNIHHISADADAHKLDLIPFHIKKGEAIFILRPTISKRQTKKLHAALDEWSAKLKEGHEVYKFPELKQWIAGLVGLVYSQGFKWLQSNIILPNPIRTKNKFFCSEFVDIVFKSAGIFLVRRSEYEGVIGPSELLYSPYLHFVGIAYNKEEEKLLNKEKMVI